MLLYGKVAELKVLPQWEWRKLTFAAAFITCMTVNSAVTLTLASYAVVKVIMKFLFIAQTYFISQSKQL